MTDEPADLDGPSHTRYAIYTAAVSVGIGLVWTAPHTTLGAVQSALGISLYLAGAVLIIAGVLRSDEAPEPKEALGALRDSFK